ncbi:hypothetical protein Tco_0123812 [Tanacetum coccineum]
MRPSAIALGIILLLFPYKEDLRNLALFLAILMPVIILAIGRDLSFEGLDIKLRDMPEGVLVLFGLSHVWKSHVVIRTWGADGNGSQRCGFSNFCFVEEPHLDVRPTLQRLPFYCTPLAVADSIIPDPTLEDLAASASGATLSHVSKRTKTAMAQSSGSTTRPSLFVDNSDGESDDDGDACIEIPLITPLHSVAVIPYSGNQGGSSAATLLKVLTPKGIMVDDAAAPSIGVSRLRPSSRLAPSFRDVSGDAIHTDFFPFLSVLIMPLILKMSVLHYMMMSHGGDLLARYRGLNQSQYEYALSADSRLKGYKEKAKGKNEWRKRQSLTKSLDNLHAEVACLSADLNQATILEAEKDEEILRLKATPPKVNSFLWLLVLAHPANVPALRDARVSPPITKESTVTPASESLELPTNVAPTSSTVTSGPGNVVVPLSVGEKGDGSLPSSAIDQEAAANPSERTLVAPSLGKTDCRCVVVHPADPETMVGVDIDTLTMEQYLALSRENQAPGMVKPEIGGNVNFEIKSQFVLELRKDTFFGNKEEDVHDHIDRVDRLAPGTINTWDLLKKAFIQRYCPPSMTAKQLEDIHNFKKEGDESLYQAWERTTSSNVETSSSKDGLAALVNMLVNMGRDMKKLKENVHAIQVGC